jgi:hypothetical protein
MAAARRRVSLMVKMLVTNKSSPQNVGGPLLCDLDRRLDLRRRVDRALPRTRIRGAGATARRFSVSRAALRRICDALPIPASTRFSSRARPEDDQGSIPASCFPFRAYCCPFATSSASPIRLWHLRVIIAQDEIQPVGVASRTFLHQSRNVQSDAAEIPTVTVGQHIVADQSCLCQP